jgi:cytochrome P450
VLDRKPNPHVAFGSGVHNCLGALHARLIIRTLLRQLVEKVEAIRVVACAHRFEVEKDYTRRSGYDELTVVLEPSDGARG